MYLDTLDFSCSMCDLCLVIWDSLLYCIDSYIEVRGLSSCGAWV